MWNELETKYVRGPWYVEYDKVDKSYVIKTSPTNPIDVGIRISKGEDQSINEQKANANLVANAPFMYDSLLSIARIAINLETYKGNKEFKKLCKYIVSHAHEAIQWINDEDVMDESHIKLCKEILEAKE